MPLLFKKVKIASIEEFNNFCNQFPNVKYIDAIVSDTAGVVRGKRFPVNEIKKLSDKAKNGSLTIEDLQGGTFTISNGGVYGSMLSTPILNPPQSGVLGMHNIIERPIALNGEIKIKPIMYLALSYDHRIIDGAEAARFCNGIRDNLGKNFAFKLAI